MEVQIHKYHDKMTSCGDSPKHEREVKNIDFKDILDTDDKHELKQSNILGTLGDCSKH